MGILDIFIIYHLPISINIADICIVTPNFSRRRLPQKPSAKPLPPPFLSKSPNGAILSC